MPKTTSTAQLKDPPPQPKASTAAAKKTKTKANGGGSSAASGNDDDTMNIFLPNSLYNNSNGECTVLVQIDPEDSATLDFAGAVGAIGRLEADATGVTLDLKGHQYQGRIYPGATALVLSVVKGKNKDDTQGGVDYLKVDAMTDEFCRLVMTGKNALDMLNAVGVGFSDSDSHDDDDDTKNKDASAPPTETISAGSHNNHTAKMVRKREAVPLSKKKAINSTNGSTASKKRTTSAKKALGQKGETSQPTMTKQPSKNKRKAGSSNTTARKK